VKISILMPTYDCPPDLLEKSILSVFEQTHTDVELIVKDGCISNPAISDPRVRNLISRLGSKVTYILSPDGPPPEESGFFKHNGFYQALNECVNASTGEVLSLLCSDDDRGDSETLAFVNAEFEKHGDSPFFLYGITEYIDTDDKTTLTIQPPIVPITYEGLLKAYTLGTPAFFWNRAVHDKFGLFNAGECPWSADLEFWLRCWRGMNSKFVPRVLGRYRVWGISQCVENQKLVSIETARILEKHGAKMYGT
jgi:glycosyltransferase involved in cell wall biosynthesis